MLSPAKRPATKIKPGELSGKLLFGALVCCISVELLWRCGGVGDAALYNALKQEVTGAVVCEELSPPGLQVTTLAIFQARPLPSLHGSYWQVFAAMRSLYKFNAELHDT